LEDVVIDRRGRSEAGPGSHDEDMIVLGLACHLLGTYPLYVPKEKSDGDKWLESVGLLKHFEDDDAERDNPFTVWRS
jgi:hypothetical protein